MRRFAGFLVAALALSSPAVAQGPGGGMIGDTLGVSNYGAKIDFNAALRGSYQAPASQFSFYPDPALRTAVTNNVMADIARNDRSLASAMGRDPFAAFGPALSQHSIRDSQIDDALAFMLIALWDAANASDAETSPGQTAAVKRQARALLMSMGGRPRGVSMQEASDQLYLSALMVSVLASKVIETRDPAAIAELQRMAQQESLASFGVDFSRMTMDSRGLMPR